MVKTVEKKWKCETCDVCFVRKKHFDAHLLTIKHQTKVGETVIGDVEKVRLVNEVEQLRNELIEFKARVEKLERERDMLRRIRLGTQNCPVESNINNNQQINNTFTNCGNTNITINVAPYGEEKWDFLTDGEVLQIMKGVNSCIPEMVKTIHFNKEHPENQNIRLPNKKVPQIRTFNGSGWDTKNKKDIIEGLIRNIVDRLESGYGEEFRNNATKFIRDLWEEKMLPITNDKIIDKDLRKQVEFSILDGQSELK
tara:strand:+ start:8700 stop:9461 length:762 start_codon:yes stop_codon:yes gene_type:complete